MGEIDLEYKKKAYDELQKEYESRIKEIEREIQNLQVEKYKCQIKQNIYNTLYDKDKLNKCSEDLKKIRDKENGFEKEVYDLDTEYEKFKRLKDKFETKLSL